MNNHPAQLEEVVNKLKDILGSLEPDKVNVWPDQVGTQFVTKLQSKTDSCAKYMIEQISAAVTLYKAKNTDYGDSFGKTYAQFGPIAALVRMSDKINRISSLMSLSSAGQKVSDESIKDTLMDLVCYSLMTMYEMECADGSAKQD